ncbi:MAG TPA: polymer-forming cytoskeletal protein [Candidatus Dormibacteraeota bacterium]|nr:polymer-forming cytoskeletal protein [Candidatus Dormibacteraeota bacterium]
MWSKQQAVAEPPAASSSSVPPSTVIPFNSSPSKLGSNSSCSAARLGAGIRIKGQVTGAEDLQIDGVVDGPISLKGCELTVGADAQLTSEIHAGNVVAYGKVVGNIHARGRVDIRRDGSITGNISCARISIEDGAHFKGRIEIDPTKTQSAAD